jgi:outer membrane protein assembly factor BamB
MTDNNSNTAVEPAYEAPSARARPPRVWPAVALMVVLWLWQFISGRIELTMFEKFGARMIVSGLVLLLFLVWWFTLGRVSWLHRLLVLGAVIVGEFVFGKLAHPSVRGFFWVIFTAPVVLTVWTGWWLVARKRAAGFRDVGLVMVIFAVLGVFALLRMDGLSGEQDLNLHLRWTPTPEERLAAKLPQPAGTTATSRAAALVMEPGDWPGFRGPDRDGVVHGTQISTDWATHPPRLVWKHPVGPAWSSMAIVGNRLFTQEQYRDVEVVSCYDAETGDAVWVHQDQSRFFETLSGAGPRATPMFVDGKLFVMGGSGILNCLDAASGNVIWSRNVATDAKATLPMWGYASSPLVTHGVVIVYGGGQPKGLVAYRADSGEPAWSVPAGGSSYTSAQLASVDGKDQVLFLSDQGLVSVDPESGAVLWQYDLPAQGAPRAIQPRMVGPREILIASETDLGTGLLEVSDQNNQWKVERQWKSRALKPSFNDLVVQDGFAYGFDGAIFCCIELKSGQRQWKEGRYGHGQVLLLADQKLLLVASEEGEAVLLEARPDAHHELSKIPAVTGKTWNHPAIAHGRLYVRSDQEMACYELSGAK